MINVSLAALAFRFSSSVSFMIFVFSFLKFLSFVSWSSSFSGKARSMTPFTHLVIRSLFASLYILGIRSSRIFGLYIFHLLFVERVGIYEMVEVLDVQEQVFGSS